MAQTSKMFFCFKNITSFKKVNWPNHLFASAMSGSLWNLSITSSESPSNTCSQGQLTSDVAKTVIENQAHRYIWEETVKAMLYLCYFFKIFMPFLQSSGAMKRLPHTCVFAQKCFPMVLNPIQHLQRKQVICHKNNVLTCSRFRAIYWTYMLLSKLY